LKIFKNIKKEQYEIKEGHKFKIDELVNPPDESAVTIKLVEAKISHINDTQITNF